MHTSVAANVTVNCCRRFLVLCKLISQYLFGPNVIVIIVMLTYKIFAGLCECSKWFQ